MSKLVELGIPESFQILNHTVTIKEIPVLPDMGRYGDWDEARNEIRLFTDGACDDVIRHAYYHELAHCLLDRSGRQDLSQDETLVDFLGGLLAQYASTQRPTKLSDSYTCSEKALASV